MIWEPQHDHGPCHLSFFNNSFEKFQGKVIWEPQHDRVTSKLML